MRAPLASTCAVALVVASLTGCASYSSALGRSQRAFEDGELERALAVLRALGSDFDRLSAAERAQYAYLRGTIDFRMGYRVDARYWLAIGAALEAQTPGSLPPDWSDRLHASLHDLDEEAFKAVGEDDAAPTSE